MLHYDSSNYIKYYLDSSKNKFHFFLEIELLSAVELNAENL